MPQLFLIFINSTASRQLLSGLAPNNSPLNSCLSTDSVPRTRTVKCAHPITHTFWNIHAAFTEHTHTHAHTRKHAHTHTLHTPFPAQSHHLLFDLRARPHGKTISRGRVQCIGFEEESPTKDDTHSPPPSNNFTACSNSTWRLVTRLNKTILHSQPAPRRSTGRRRRVAHENGTACTQQSGRALSSD